MARCNEHVHTEQLAIFLGQGFIVTFQGEHPGDSLEPVRKRIRIATSGLLGEGRKTVLGGLPAQRKGGGDLRGRAESSEEEEEDDDDGVDDDGGVWALARLESPAMRRIDTIIKRLLTVLICPP